MCHYRVVSIERVPPQEAGRPGTWHRYIIASDIHTIIGYHRGDRAEAERYAGQSVARLNARHLPPRFKGPQGAHPETVSAATT